MKSFRIAALAGAIASLIAGSALACTTVVVGQEATSDGSILIARSADSSALKAQHLVIHPAKKGQKGMYRTTDHHGANNFEYPLPENAMRFTTVPNWQTQVHGATGWNEAGVGFSGTESIFARDDALKIDPYVEDTGITEDDIPDVLLPVAKTAREAVQLLGSIVETKGAGEGFGVVLMDEKEVWYFETGTGHQWLAQRAPKNQYFASGNQGRLQKYDPKSPDFLASKTLVEFAVKNGFYDPKKDGEFNFSKAYCRDDDRDRDYNDPRVWQIQKLLTPSLEQPVQAGRSFPVWAAPDQKVTIADLKAIMRNHFESGELQSHDPYTKGLRGDEPYRPVSVFRTYESHVMQVRPWLPRAIGEVTYLAMGMADLSVYFPVYSGVSAYPEHFGMGTDKADDKSLYWKFRKLQTLVMTDYPTLAPVVKKAYAEFEKEVEGRMKTFEDSYVKTLKKDPAAAQKSLDDFNIQVIADAEALTADLMNQVFTIRTADIQKDNFFANRKKKD
ncbi:C69 family dipeptidase [Sutterella wadsworthensis]|uniref:C69 family dipeptidase n=1 Tax=Sutterella wadsworthensis TaxID=40545 RepID=UPI003AB97158